MKKCYETPIVEKIEFDYVEAVRANSNGFAGGCGTGGTSGYVPDQGYSIHPTYGQTVYRDSNPGYTCQNSLAPDQSCGLEQGNYNHTNNPGHFC